MDRKHCGKMLVTRISSLSLSLFPPPPHFFKTLFLRVVKSWDCVVKESEKETLWEKKKGCLTAFLFPTFSILNKTNSSFESLLFCCMQVF